MQDKFHQTRQQLNDQMGFLFGETKPAMQQPAELGEPPQPRCNACRIGSLGVVLSLAGVCRPQQTSNSSQQPSNSSQLDVDLFRDPELEQLDDFLNDGASSPLPIAVFERGVRQKLQLLV